MARVAREALGYRMQSVQTDELARSSLLLLLLLLLHRLAGEGVERQSSAHSIVEIMDRTENTNIMVPSTTPLRWCASSH